MTICHSRTRDLAAVCSRADVLVAAVGRDRMVQGDWVKPGAAVIDVGMNRTDDGLFGDVNFDAAAEVAGAITPVPGGVGPMTIAMLLRNTLSAARLQRGVVFRSNAACAAARYCPPPGPQSHQGGSSCAEISCAPPSARPPWQAALIPAAPAGAIVGGTPDTVHTNVGLVRFTTVDGRFRCSGTLVSARVVLTAGHCTEGPATDVYVSFDDALAKDPLEPGISSAEKAARAAHYITGVAHPDPGWDGS